MSKIDDGGPAYPAPVEVKTDFTLADVTSGMSLRDWFAGQALQAFMRLTYSIGGGYAQYTTHADEAARCSYQLADAMLKARQP